ncbi:(2Fe-2S)-binding protein [Planctomicrobium sp. SH527]|uniref:(2Fe-2S)-binding protein n=1 Tax=Planctomicrobium sp. SH527 TaxID=3448123 RepID=UPI003F5B8A2F
MSNITVAADPILCHCFKVRQSTVEDTVAIYGATTVQDVRQSCKAGGGCMACRRRIQNVIDECRKSRTLAAQDAE